MTNHDHHNETDQAGGVDVPLSVWPVWSQTDLVDRLVRQFTIPDEIVTLLDVEGIVPVTDSGRHCTVFCDRAGFARERNALATAGESEGLGFVFSYESEAIDIVEHFRTGPRSVLTICRDSAYWDASLWWALTESIPSWGLLALLWDGPAISPAARSACAGAGLSYAGHIIAAETSEFDRAAATTAGLAQLEPGDPRRAHNNVGLWARYPSRIDGSGQ
jgi:hypothetical protein